jgi:quercetin dioxygenase-like cupin family protein
MKTRRIRNTPSTAPVLRKFRRGYRWDNVELERYKLTAHRGGEFCGASRQVLIGKSGERTRFHVRYFELAPRGFTSLEQHRHSHVVIGARGSGRVRVGERDYRLRPMDTIYIAPNQPHQLRAIGAAQFGFFCIVDAKRDRPRPVESQTRGLR